MKSLIFGILSVGAVGFFAFDGDDAVKAKWSERQEEKIFAEDVSDVATVKKESTKKPIQLAQVDTSGPSRLIVGLDLSASNPLVLDNRYAHKAALRVGDVVGDLAYRSEYSIRTFGAYDSSNNPFTFDAIVSVRNEAAALKNDTVTFISNVPLLVQQGKLKTQNMTNILAFLEELALNVDCDQMPTTVILVTDGVEDSEYVRLVHRNAHLPKTKKIFKGCYELQILGIGRGVDSPSETKRLREEWKKWSKRAGFQEFNAYNDW
jgi:hypothetical protein